MHALPSVSGIQPVATGGTARERTKYGSSSAQIGGHTPPRSGLFQRYRSKPEVAWTIRSPRRRGPAAAAKAIAAARDGKIKPACFVCQEDEFSVSRSPLIETRPPNFRETTQSQPRRPRGKSAAAS